MHKAVTMEDVVGTRVLIQLDRTAYELLDLPGVYSEKFAADVTGIDELGMWIEHPNYKVVPVYDQHETYIPPEQRREESHRAVILVRWDYIATVIQFPERTGWRAGADESDIGFKPRLNGNDPKEDAGG
ncbi:hypothetical protein KDL29_15245 [bacterium]|nr:hypothetical protein [bacterium]